MSSHFLVNFRFHSKRMKKDFLAPIVWKLAVHFGNKAEAEVASLSFLFELDDTQGFL